MTDVAALAIRLEHLEIVVRLLRAHLLAEACAWAFGSRVTGRAKPYSDLDLAIDAARPLSLDDSAALAEAFSESDLPYKVDLVDWWRTGERFRRIIAEAPVRRSARGARSP